MDRKRARYLWVAALVTGAILRLLFLHTRPEFSDDALMYGDLAHNMLAHHVFGFTQDILRPTLIRLPGYPLFLAACFVAFGNANYVAAILVQIAVDLAGCALLGSLAARIAGKRAGVIAVWLAALCPFTANYSIVALTETLSIFCVVLAFISLERWDARNKEGEVAAVWALLTGCAMSFAVLLRPGEGLLAAAIVPVMLCVSLRQRHQTLQRRLAPAMIASIVVLLPLLGWTVRNWRTFHVVQPLAPRYANDPDETVPRGFQRWFRTWAIDYKSTYNVYWNYNDNELRLTDLPRRAFDNAEQLEQTRALFSEYNQTTTSTSAFDQAFDRIAKERISDHPLRYYVELPVARELDMWLRPRTELMRMPMAWWSFRSHPKESGEEVAYALLNGAYLTLAIAGFFRWRSQRWNGRGAVALAMLGFVCMRCLLLLTLDNSEPRYTLECFPVVILLASFALLPRKQSLID